MQADYESMLFSVFFKLQLVENTCIILQLAFSRLCACKSAADKFKKFFLFFL